MKTRRSFTSSVCGLPLFALVLAGGLLLRPTPSVAATNWFDPVPGTAALEGGTGNWAGNTNWKSTSNGTSGVAWTDGNDAWFQPTSNLTNNLGGATNTVGTLYHVVAGSMVVLTNGSLVVNGISSLGNSNLILNLTSLSLGAGGITNQNSGNFSAKTIYLGSNATLTANQAWAVSNTGGVTISGLVNLGGNTLTLSAASSSLFQGNLAGSGNVIATGASDFTLKGTNTYAGYTLVLGALSFGAGTVQASGVISNQGMVSFVGATANPLMVGSAIVGTGLVSVSSSGTQYLTNANSYSGGTFLIQNSTLWASNASALGVGMVVISNGGTINLAGFTHALSNVTLLSGANVLQNGTFTTPRLEANSGTISANLAGTGAVFKLTTGSMVFSGTNSYSGPTTIFASGLTNTAATGLPIGSGSLVLTNTGTLALRPAGSGGALTLVGGTNPGSTFAYSGGDILNLATGSYTGLTLNFGPGDPATPVLTRVGRGTLVIQDDGTTSTLKLGGSIKILFNGQTPTNINGMVSPSLVRIAVSAGQVPEFLTYDPSYGLTGVTYAVNYSGLGVAVTNSPTATVNVKNAGGATGTNVVGDGSTVGAYALRIGGGTTPALLLLSNNATLVVGNPSQSSEAGLILSGGAPSGIYQASGTTNGALDFGTAEGIVAVGNFAGIIGVGIKGSNGFTKFGDPASALILMGATSTVTGPLSVNQGSLILSNNAAYLGASTVSVLGTLNVQSGSTLNAASDFLLGPQGTLSPLAASASVNTAGQFLNAGAAAGALTLSGGNLVVGSLISTNFAASTTLNAGTLTVSNGLQIAGGATYNVGNAAAQTFTLNVLGGSSNFITGALNPAAAANMVVAMNFLGGTNYIAGGNGMGLGASAGSTGILNVVGPSTFLQYTNGRMAVGSSTVGSWGFITISNGATMRFWAGGSGSPSGMKGSDSRVVVDNGLLETMDAGFYFAINTTNNLFMVTNGGRAVLAHAGLTMGNPSTGFPGAINSISNRIVVTGAGSVISNTGTSAAMAIGGTTNSVANQLQVLDGGSLSIAYSGGLVVGTGTNAYNNSVVVAGNGARLTSSQVTLGSTTSPNSTNNSLWVTNGGLAQVGSSGLLLEGTGGKVVVGGTGSRIESAGLLTVGNSGSFNTFEISNGGVVTNGSGSIGSSITALSNSLLVAGTGSVWSNANLTIGNSGSYNTLSVTGGGTVVSATGVIGSAAGASNNAVLVSGAGSSWSIGGALTLGNNAGSIGGSLVVSNGGRVYSTGSSYLGKAKAAPFGQALLTGSGSLWTNTTLLFAGQSNTLLVLNGAVFQGMDTTLGEGTSASMSSNNTIVVASGGAWTNLGALSIGNFGNGNRFLVTNGGTVFVAGAVDVGNASAAPSAGQTITNNQLLVSDLGSRMAVGGDLTVGGRPNLVTPGIGYVVVSNGAQLVAGNIYVSPRSVNPLCTFDLTGPGSLAQASSFFVGMDSSVTTGSGGVARVSNGATLDMVNLKTGTTNNFIANTGGIYQFATNAPSIAAGTPNSITLTNGTIAFRDSANVNIKGNWGVGTQGRALTNISFAGNNTFRLNNSATTNAGQDYTFGTGLGATNYVALEMVNGNTLWQGGGLTLGAGGSLLVSNTVASILGTLASTGTITVANASVTFASNVVLQGGSSYAARAGTNAFNAGLTIDAGATMSMDAFSVLTGAVTNNSVLQILTNAIYALTGGQLPAGSGALNITYGGALTFSNGAFFGLGSGGITNLGTLQVQNLGVLNFGGNQATPYGSGALQVDLGGTLNFTTGSFTVVNSVNNFGTLFASNANVTYGAPVTVGGLYVSDPSTNTFTSNVTVTASGALQGSNGDLFVFQKDLFMQSTNASQFSLSQSAMLFSNGPGHLLSVSNSGALNLGQGYSSFSQVASNFAIGTLSIAAGNKLTIAGNKDSLTNALYVGWLDIQGLTPGDTNSYLAVSNVLVTALSLPNINLYYDVYDSRNDWLTMWLPPVAGAGYDLWGGGLLLPIPEPSSTALLLLGALAVAGAVRFRRKPSEG